MKKTIFTLLVLSMTLITNANGVDPKTILVSNKWQLDIENTIGLNTKDIEGNKSKATKKLIKELNLTFEFLHNDIMIIQMLDVAIYNGGYKLVKGKDAMLFIQKVDKDEFLYEIISIQNEKIILRPVNEEVDLILVPIEKSNLDLFTTLISNVWMLDDDTVESMLKKIESKDQYKNMTDEEKNMISKSTQMALEGSRYIFNKDYSYLYKVLGMGKEIMNTKGTFSINKEKNEIITDTEYDPNQVYKIIKIEENKIHLYNILRENDLILIPVNNF